MVLTLNITPHLTFTNPLISDPHLLRVTQSSQSSSTQGHRSLDRSSTAQARAFNQRPSRRTTHSNVYLVHTRSRLAVHALHERAPASERHQSFRSVVDSPVAPAAPFVESSAALLALEGWHDEEEGWQDDVPRKLMVRKCCSRYHVAVAAIPTSSGVTSLQKRAAKSLRTTGLRVKLRQVDEFGTRRKSWATLCEGPTVSYRRGDYVKCTHCLARGALTTVCGVAATCDRRGRVGRARRPSL